MPEFLSPNQIMVAAPAYTGKVEIETANSLLAARDLFGHLTFIAGCCHIGLARAKCALQALSKIEVKKLVFVDSDICFTPEQFHRLVNHPVDIVGGIYTLRNTSGTPAARPLPGQTTAPKELGLWEVAGVATGFMCITRNALETIMAKWQNRWANTNSEPVFDFFPSGLSHDFLPGARSGPNEFLTDDYGFCALARESGLKVYADTAICVGHKGSIMFQSEVKAG